MAAPTNIWYTDVGTVQAGNVNILANLDDPNLSAGRLQLITATYTMTGNEVANDAIYIARLPSGAIVDVPSGNIATAGHASGAGTILVGDTDTWGGTRAYDPARYCGSVDIHAGNTTVGFPFTGGTALNAPQEITDDWVFLLATLATLTTPTANRLIVFRIKVAMLD